MNMPQKILPLVQKKEKVLPVTKPTIIVKEECIAGVRALMAAVAAIRITAAGPAGVTAVIHPFGTEMEILIMFLLTGHKPGIFNGPVLQPALLQEVDMEAMVSLTMMKTHLRLLRELLPGPAKADLHGEVMEEGPLIILPEDYIWEAEADPEIKMIMMEEEAGMAAHLFT